MGCHDIQYVTMDGVAGRSMAISENKFKFKVSFFGSEDKTLSAPWQSTSYQVPL